MRTTFVSCAPAMPVAWGPPARQVLAGESGIEAGERCRATPLVWKSSRLKRSIESSLSAEAIAFNQGLAELEYCQVMFRDVLYRDVALGSWELDLDSFVPVLRSTCVSGVSARAFGGGCEGCLCDEVEVLLWKSGDVPSKQSLHRSQSR